MNYINKQIVISSLISKPLTIIQEHYSTVLYIFPSKHRFLIDAVEWDTSACNFNYVPFVSDSEEETVNYLYNSIKHNVDILAPGSLNKLEDWKQSYEAIRNNPDIDWAHRTLEWFPWEDNESIIDLHKCNVYGQPASLIFAQRYIRISKEHPVLTTNNLNTMMESVVPNCIVYDLMEGKILVNDCNYTVK